MNLIPENSNEFSLAEAAIELARSLTALARAMILFDTSKVLIYQLLVLFQNCYFSRVINQFSAEFLNLEF